MRHLVFPALLLAATTGPALLHAQAKGGQDNGSGPIVVYDWSTGGKQGPALYAGQRVRFQVVNVNPLCYNVGIDAQAVNAEVDVTNLMTVIRTQQTTSQPNEQTQRTAEQGDREVRLLFQGAATDPAVIRQQLQIAQTEINVARAHLQAAELERSEAAFVIEAVTKPSCAAGRSFNFGTLVARWRALVAASRPNDLLFLGLDQLDKGNEALRRAREALSSIGNIPPGNAELVESARTLVNEYATLSAQAQALTTTLPALRSALRSAGARLDVLSEQSEAPEDQLTLGHDADRVKVTIRSYPVVGSGAAALDDVVDEIRVRRRYRAFLSTGVLVTSVRQPHYGQVHRQGVNAQGVPIPDSTFLTYAETEAGGFSAFSPAVQLNVSFVHEPASLLLSFGATPRTVNRSVGVEPFFGLSGTLLDRLVATVGWHWGRQEYLLLGDEDEVEKRPIPADITREEAVGTRWAHGFFASFSIRP